MNKEIYAEKALNQIPRLLGNLDRNKFSPTYGCFHRDYWLDKTSDFPDAVRQFGVHSLALVYKYDFPNNIYKQNKKIKDWCIAAILYWCNIQHKDGSFDEFYPYERGWVGPTAFTLYTICEAFTILQKEIIESDRITILKSIKKAAYFISKGESEEDHLANHHAMACLALWKAHKVLNDLYLLEAYNNAFKVFQTYHYPDEGWSREYDGVDPGYLSATVSFFAKIYKDNKDEKLLPIINQSIEFSKYFVYPNGFYAGSLGSRNTLHFYAHGYEVMANENPLAGRISIHLSNALLENKLVSPEIISDRYVFYRVPEFLLAYIDRNETEQKIALPFEQEIEPKLFNRSKLGIYSNNTYHLLTNLSKGGVVKIFTKKDNKLVYNNCGIIGELDNGKVVTSQWIDNSYSAKLVNSEFIVEGKLNIVPSNKLFNPLKNIIFRCILLLTSWSSKLGHTIKGKIRKTLILGQRQTSINFKRVISLRSSIKITTTIDILDGSQFKSLSIGDEFFVRYVPQSRYFQHQELNLNGWDANPDELAELNSKKHLEYVEEIG